MAELSTAAFRIELEAVKRAIAGDEQRLRDLNERRFWTAEAAYAIVARLDGLRRRRRLLEGQIQRTDEYNALVLAEGAA